MFWEIRVSWKIPKKSKVEITKKFMKKQEEGKSNE